MYQHPKTAFWMIDQDRERALAQRALERAARDGYEKPGLFKGGISSLAKAVRGATTTLHAGGPRQSTGLTGTTGA